MPARLATIAAALAACLAGGASAQDVEAGARKAAACVACHMPQIEQTIADVNVRSHTFAFITPEMTAQFKIPNACTGCHTDKTTSWATEALKSWSGLSPWRAQ